MNDNTHEEQAPPGSAEALPPEAADRAEPVAVLQPDDVNVQVPADMLKQALTQLKELATLRRQESERQQLMMDRMRDEIKKHSRVNRLVLLSCLVVLFALFVAATLLKQVVTGGEEMRGGLSDVRTGLTTAVLAVEKAGAQQSALLDNATESIRTAAAAQAKELAGVAQGLASSQARQADLAKTVTASVASIRQERDAVETRVREVLEEKTSQFTAREIALQDEARRIREEAVKTKEERRRIIGDAIQQLAALEGAELPAAPAVAAIAPKAGTGLDQYRLKGSPIPLAGVTDDLSGITFNPETGTLFAILNDPTHIYELTRDGQVKRVIDLNGFEDTEDITHVEGNRFAVVEERRRNLCLFEIGPDTRSVDYGDAVKVLVDAQPAGNVGIEGVAYDKVDKRYFVVKEKSPRQIYEIGASAPGQPARAPSAPWDIEKDSMGMNDLSGVYADPDTGHLLILSDESKCIVECTADGREVARLSLAAGAAGLAEAIRQPEGLTMAPDGTLYVVSEPDVLYIFNKQGTD